MRSSGKASSSGRWRSFGAPDALRITAGTPDEVAFLGDAVAALAAPVATSLR